MTKRRSKIFALIGVIALLVIGGGYFALTRTLDHVLNDGTLQRLVSQKTAVILKADAGYLPLRWRGWSVRSDGLMVRGKPPRGLGELRASDLRAHCSVRDLWRRKWTITQLQAERLEVAFGTAAATKLTKIPQPEPELQPQVDTPSPLTVDVRETAVPHMDVGWGEEAKAVGFFKDVNAHFYTRGKDLEVHGAGGTFEQTAFPVFKVDVLELYYAKPRLEVRKAVFTLERARNLTVTGQLDFGETGAMHLQMLYAQLPAARFASGFWRDKLEGTIEGETALDQKFEAQAKVSAAGSIQFVHLVLHDVPAFQQIALLTRHPQFKQPKPEIAHLKFRWNGDALEVTELEVEQKGLFRMEGKFRIEHDNINGTFEIGAAPDVIDAIPCAREKVFTTQRAGYLWTTMHLDGPAKHPREDLKQRLLAAAQEHFAKGLLAPILKPGQSVLQLLGEIYP